MKPAAVSPNRRQPAPLPTAPIQRVFAVGRKPGTLDELEPVFSDFSIEARRVVSGVLALEQVRYAAPDLLIVEHPLPDMSTHDFVNSIRNQVSEKLTILVLTPESRIGDLAELESNGELILRSDGPRDRFLESAKSFLRRDRRTPCNVMVRLSVRLGDSQLLRLAQMVNLSRNGMLVRTSEQVPLGADVAFEIYLSERSEPLRGAAQTVRYVRGAGNEVLAVGLKFVELRNSGRERLLSFLESPAG